MASALLASNRLESSAGQQEFGNGYGIAKKGISMKARLCFMSAILGSLSAVCFAGIPQNKPAKTARFGDPTTTAQHLQNYVYGVVKKVAKDQLVLDKTMFGDDQPFRIEAKTKYIYDGKAGKLEDFKVGDKVFVQIKKDKKTGDMIATRVVSGLPSTELP